MTNNLIIKKMFEVSKSVINLHFSNVTVIMG